MSYDLSLAFAKRPTITAIEAAISRAGLEAQGGIRRQFLAVSPTDPAIALDISGPTRIEDQDDVEEQLLTAVPRARWDMFISRPASAEDEGVRLATQIAEELAAAFAGAVYDPQAEKLIFPRGIRPPANKVPDKIRVVKLTWLLPQPGSGRATAAALLAVIREHSPPRLPSRYDETEPMRHRLEPGGEDEFAGVWERLNHDVLPMLFWKSTPPCFGGSALLVGHNPEKVRPVEIEAEFDGRLVESDAQARAAIVALFTAAARRLGAFYAAGYVLRNWIVERRALFGDRDAENLAITKTVDSLEWAGFPQFPVWLTWFGPPYREWVRPSLNGYPVDEYLEGVALRIGELPQDVDQLAGRYPTLPPELCRQRAEPPPLPPYLLTTKDWSTPASVVLDLRRPLG